MEGYHWLFLILVFALGVIVEAMFGIGSYVGLGGG